MQTLEGREQLAGVGRVEAWGNNRCEVAMKPPGLPMDGVLGWKAIAEPSTRPAGHQPRFGGSGDLRDRAQQQGVQGEASVRLQGERAEIQKAVIGGITPGGRVLNHCR